MSDHEYLMSNTNYFTTEYVANHIKNLEPELVKNVIRQMGGEDMFVDKYEDINFGSVEQGVQGFITAPQRIKFYQANKENLLMYCAEIAKSNGSNSAINFTYDDVYNESSSGVNYTHDEVAQALFGSLSEHDINHPSEVVDRSISFVVYLALELICEEYAAMLRNDI